MAQAVSATVKAVKSSRKFVTRRAAVVLVSVVFALMIAHPPT